MAKDGVNTHLIARGSPVKVVIDSRKVVSGALFVGLPGENHDGSSFAGEALDKGVLGVVVNRNVWGSVKEKAMRLKRAAICVADPLYYFGELSREKRVRNRGAKFVGITGSAGKTTTKDMVSKILNRAGVTFQSPGNFNNLIGLPLSLMMMRDEDKFGVFEMGTNRPGEIGRLTEILSPHVGVITNIGPAHLEGLGGVDGVQREKSALFEKMGRSAVAVVNDDDLRIRAVSELHRGKKVIIGGKNGDVRGKILNMQAESMHMLISYGEETIDVVTSYPGLQFFKNALYAAGVALALGISKELVREGLASFIPDTGRFVIHQLGDDVVLIDDTYNANPLSVEVAVDNIIQIFPGKKVIFLLGDMLELGEAAESSHLRMGDLASSLNPYRIYTYGELAGKIMEGARNAGYPASQCYHASDVDDIAEHIIGDTIAGSVILIKGSRMMKLERVVKKIIESLPPGSDST